MKKQYLFLSLFVFSLLSTSTFAQDHKFWIGGDLGLNSHKTGDNDNITDFKIGCVFGYHINDKMSVGIHEEINTAKDVFGSNSTVFFRYGKNLGDKASLFGEFGINVGSSANTANKDITNIIIEFGLGIRPGITYMLSNNWGIEAHFGNLGFKSRNHIVDGEAVDAEKHTQFGLNLNMSTLGFGLNYHF